MDEWEPLPSSAIATAKFVSNVKTSNLPTVPATQGLTLVHVSAHPEPFLKQKHTLHIPAYPLTPPKQP